MKPIIEPIEQRYIKPSQTAQTIAVLFWITFLAALGLLLVILER